jgi:hypothetical protein
LPGGTRVQISRQLSTPLLLSAMNWLWNSVGLKAAKSTGRMGCVGIG